MPATEREVQSQLHATASKTVRFDPARARLARIMLLLRADVLARQLGVSKSLVSRIEHGTRRASPDLQRRWIRALARAARRVSS